MIAYEGSENYIFVSYAHKDAERVIPVIESLNAAGFRIWYDSGIEVGSEWPEYIEDHLLNSSRVLVFMTPSCVASPNCRNEINLARAQNKEMLVVYLEPTKLIKGMNLQLNSVQAINAQLHPSLQSLAEALARAQLLQCCKIGWNGESTPAAVEEQPARPVEVKAPSINEKDAKKLEELRGFITSLETLWQSLMDKTEYLSNTPSKNIKNHIANIRSDVKSYADYKNRFEHSLHISRFFNDMEFKDAAHRFDVCQSELNDSLELFDDIEKLVALEKELARLASAPQNMISSPVRQKYSALSPNVRAIIDDSALEVLNLCDSHEKRKNELENTIVTANAIYANLPAGADKNTFSFLEWAERVDKNAIMAARDNMAEYIATVEKAKQIYGNTDAERLPLASTSGRDKLFTQFASSSRFCANFKQNCNIYLNEEGTREKFRKLLAKPAGDPLFSQEYKLVMEEYDSLSPDRAKQISPSVVDKAKRKHTVSLLLKDAKAADTDCSRLSKEFKKYDLAANYYAVVLADLYKIADPEELSISLNAAKACVTKNKKLKSDLLSARKADSVGLSELMSSSEKSECDSVISKLTKIESVISYLENPALLSEIRDIEEQIVDAVNSKENNHEKLSALKSRIAKPQISKLIDILLPRELVSSIDNRLEGFKKGFENLISAANSAYAGIPEKALQPGFDFLSWAESAYKMAVTDAQKNVEKYTSSVEKAKQIYSQSLKSGMSLSDIVGIDRVFKRYDAVADACERFNQNCLFYLEVEPLREALKKLSTLNASDRYFKEKYPSLMEEYSSLSYTKAKFIPKSIVDLVQIKQSSVSVLEEANRAKESYNTLPVELKLQYKTTEDHKNALVNIYRHSKYTTFASALQSASAWLEKYKPLRASIAKMKGTNAYASITVSEVELCDQILSYADILSANTKIFGSVEKMSRLAELQKETEKLLANWTPDHEPLIDIKNRINQLKSDDLIKTLWPSDLLKKLDNGIEKAQKFKSLAAQTHVLATKVQPVTFSSYNSLSPVVEEFQKILPEIQTYDSEISKNSKLAAMPSATAFHKDFNALQKLSSDISSCATAIDSYNFAKHYSPIRSNSVQKPSTAQSTYSYLSNAIAKYKSIRTTATRFDSEHELDALFDKVYKDLAKLEKAKKKLANKNLLSFWIFELITIAIGIMLGVEMASDIFGSFYLWLVAFGAATVITCIISSKVRRFSNNGRIWVWLPNIIYGIGIMFSLYLARTGFSLWYLPACAVLVLTIIMILWATGAASDHGDGIATFFLVIAILLFVLVWGAKVVYRFQTATFVDWFLIKWIVNFFIVVWNLIVGLIQGLLQALALLIGGGYWMPGFFAGFFIPSAVLNTLMYSLIAMIITFYNTDGK